MTENHTGNQSAGPLSGLRVLELADEKGQFCGKLMADLGADVIKIEPPGGQNTRSSVPSNERAEPNTESGTKVAAALAPPVPSNVPWFVPALSRTSVFSA